MRRLLARAVYVRSTQCFICGRRGAVPCEPHRAGGVITGWFARPVVRLLPWRLTSWVNPRW